MANDAIEAKHSENVSKVDESQGVLLSKLWKEVKDWRTNWTWRIFFKTLFLGLATSLFDSLTDFNFAWSVPDDCRNSTTDSTSKPFDVVYVSSPCGFLYYKNVERLTYTFIAYPGFFFALGDHGIRGLIKQWWRGKTQGRLAGKLGHILALALEVATFIGPLTAAMWSERWEKYLPQMAPVYDFALQGMAYLSTAMVLGAKCLGVFSHGPETKRFVHNATLTETIFEAAMQLSLLCGVSLTSGNWSTASQLSTVSSVVLIGKVGVENFLGRHHHKLKQASILSKFFVAVTVFPIFVLSALFKLSFTSLMKLWGDTIYPVFLGIGLPTLTLYIVRYVVKDLAVSGIGRGVLSEILVLHLWPKNRHGKRIGLALAVFFFLLYAIPLPFVIANPEPETFKWTTDGSLEYIEWVAKLSARVQMASIVLLIVGTVAFLLTMCLILFEDRWVASIVSTFPESPNENQVSYENKIFAKFAKNI